MQINLNTLIPIFAIFTYIVLLVIVSFSRSQTPVKRAFRVFLFVMLFWAIISFFLLNGFGNALFLFRMMASSAIASMLGMYYLVQVILSKHHKWSGWVYLYGLIAILITTATNWVIQSAYLDLQGMHYGFSPWVIFIAGPGFALIIFSFFEIIRSFHLADDSSHRNRMRYLLVGLGTMIAFTMINWIPWVKYPIDYVGYSVTALVLVYATLKLQLIDIEVVFRKSLLYTIPTAIIGAGYFLIITLALSLFDGMSGRQIVLISMLVAILSAIVAQPLQEKVQYWVDRLFFREKYDSGLMLQRISRTAATFLEVNMLANMILDEISTTLHIGKAAFFLKDKHSKEFRLIAHRNLSKNMNIRLRADHPFILRLEATEDSLNKRDVDILPQFKSLWIEEREVLDQISAEYFIPLRSQDSLIGILAVGKKRIDQPYSQDDKATLITLGNQVAVAIENARLYSVEQNRRKELDSLYTLSRELISTDAMTSVLEKIVEHALESIHVTFTRILLRNEHGTFTCRAVHPVIGLEYELGLGKEEPKEIYRYFERVLKSNEPLVIDRQNQTLTYIDRKLLYLEHVHSLCICPLRIGGAPIGILILGERRHSSREAFDTDKLRLASAIADQASSAIQRARLHEQLEESFVQTILALANAIDAKDNYTSDHSERLARLATATAQRMNCTPEEIQAIDWAMHLHDIGKIGIPRDILQKAGPLTDQEWAQMKRHPEIGADIIAPVKKLQNVAPLIYSHHEKFDGTGYPRKLKAEEIPLGARILAIVDTYGAITDNRVYRRARSHHEAVQEILRCTGTQFDPHITEVFLDVIEEFHRDGLLPKQNVEVKVYAG